MSINGFKPILDRLRGAVHDTRPEEPASIGMGEMPSVRNGALPSQRRVLTAIAALGELTDTAEIELVLRSLAQRKGPVWAAGLLRRAADDVENRR